jgi:Uma2 family endonuclease
MAIALETSINYLSPSQSPFLVIDKIGFALKYGTKLGWLIVPQEKIILTFAGDCFNSHNGIDILPMLEILNDWQMSVQNVFDLLKF